MKTICLTSMAVVFLFFSTIKIKAQTNQKSLKQFELMKQFIGTWNDNMGKDTTTIWELTPFGNAMESNFNSTTKGKNLYTGKQFFGYDKKTDKIISAQLYKYSAIIEFYAFWFTSDNICFAVPYQDISNPENAILQFKFEIKSPDLFTRTITSDNKITNVRTYTRVK